MAEVHILRWPDEASSREDLAELKKPRLLMLDFGVAPPLPCDPLEDWARLVDPDQDVQARIDGLRARAERTAEVVPQVDADNVLHFRDRWVALPPIEGRLTRELVERFGAVVSRDSLTRAGWPDEARRRNALDVHIARLRRRLAPLDLGIRTVRSRGYALVTIPTE